MSTRLDVFDVRDGKEVQARLCLQSNRLLNVSGNHSTHLIEAHRHVIEAHGLNDETSGIDLIAPDGILRETRHKHNLRGSVASAHLGRSVHSIHPRQIDVHEHDVNVIGRIEKCFGRPVVYT